LDSIYLTLPKTNQIGQKHKDILELDISQTQQGLEKHETNNIPQIMAVINSSSHGDNNGDDSDLDRQDELKDVHSELGQNKDLEVEHKNCERELQDVGRRLEEYTQNQLYRIYLTFLKKQIGQECKDILDSNFFRPSKVLKSMKQTTFHRLWR
jgi:hypothetical protein